jgi:hypothetical protein
MKETSINTADVSNEHHLVPTLMTEIVNMVSQGNRELIDILWNELYNAAELVCSYQDIDDYEYGMLDIHLSYLLRKSPAKRGKWKGEKLSEPNPHLTFEEMGAVLNIIGCPVPSQEECWTLSQVADYNRSFTNFTQRRGFPVRFTDSERKKLWSLLGTPLRRSYFLIDILMLDEIVKDNDVHIPRYIIDMLNGKLWISASDKIRIILLCKEHLDATHIAELESYFRSQMIDQPSDIQYAMT